MGRFEVARAREEYYRPRQGIRPKADFDQLYELFETECNTFSDIGEIVGLTRERVRQIYTTYFLDLFPEGKSTGRKRLKVCTRKRRAIRKTNWTVDGPLLDVAIAANDHGLTVEPVWVTDSSGFRVKESTTRLRINGVVCSIHKYDQSWAPPKAKSSFYRINRGGGGRGSSFNICLLPAYTGPRMENVIDGTAADWVQTGTVTVPESTLIIPTSILSAKKIHYIPAVPTTYRFHFCHPKVDFWEYKDRWDLLEEK